MDTSILRQCASCCGPGIAILLVIAMGVGCSHAPTSTFVAQDRPETGSGVAAQSAERALVSAPAATSPDLIAPRAIASAVGPATIHPVEDTREPAGAMPAVPIDSPMSEFPIVLNQRVTLALKYLQTHRSAVIAQAFWRARRYAGMMRTIFREHGLPEELVNLAFVESDVNPRATSPAMAAGIWQFVPSTARSYGMRTTAALDERRDPEKSTRAAAEHLKSLYVRFRAWPLALAAYNAGGAAVQRAIERQQTRDFWKLRLPSETRRFVPKFMAMTIIARDPNRYGFSPPREEPHDTEVLHVNQPTEIRDIAAAAGTTVKHLRELNPELVGSTTPSDRPRYALRIPRRFTWVSHKVQDGETLATIARHYKVSPQILREANKLGQSDDPHVGRVILVPAKPLLPPA
jgi:membrane-bound lytic murein transglycosylase D